jgi:glycosyltransferase involved in cell wall biosynthesis
MDKKLRACADLVLYCSRMLFDEEAGSCRQAAFVDHGVDFDQFSAAGDDATTEPEDVKSIAHPRVGYVGSMDAHTFDPKLFNEVVRLLPDMQFVMVGSSSLPVDWCTASNVHFLGQKDYSEVARYMAACDVLIMPWNNSDWIKACNPIKLKEYLATGRPVVTTPFDELKAWSDIVRVAEEADAFAAQIRAAVDENCDRAALRDRVRHETWAAKANAVRITLSDLGISW